MFTFHTKIIPFSNCYQVWRAYYCSMIKILKSFIRVWSSPMGEEKESQGFELEVDFASKIESLINRFGIGKRYTFAK